MAVEIAADRGADGREKALFAEFGEQAEALELVLHRILQLGEAQARSPPPADRLISSARLSAAVTSTLVTGSAATTSQRTGVGDAATASRTRSLNNSALAKNSGASQRNSTRPGIRRAFGIARDVVVALDAFRAAQHRRVRPPAVPQELDDGDRPSPGLCPGWHRDTATPTKQTIESQNSHRWMR